MNIQIQSNEDKIIEECKRNKKLQKKNYSYFIDVWLTRLRAVSWLILPTFIIFLIGVILFFPEKKFLKKILLVITVISSFIAPSSSIILTYVNRKNISKELGLEDVSKRLDRVKKICNAFDIMPCTPELIGQKIDSIANLREQMKQYRTKVFKLLSWWNGVFFGTILTFFIKKNLSFNFVKFIVCCAIPVILIIYLCSVLGYKIFKSVVENFLIPYGGLLSYSKFWLSIAKNDLEEINKWKTLNTHVFSGNANKLLKEKVDLLNSKVLISSNENGMSEALKIYQIVKISLNICKNKDLKDMEYVYEKLNSNWKKYEEYRFYHPKICKYRMLFLLKHRWNGLCG